MLTILYRGPCSTFAYRIIVIESTESGKIIEASFVLFIFGAVINIIEDYDRMIRIILLTTIPCTHLDIVHSSQYV